MRFFPPPLRRSLLRLLTAVFCCAALPAAQAVERVTLLLSGNDGVYAEFADAFEAALAASGRPLRLQRALSSPALSERAPEGAELVVAVGTQALRDAGAWRQGPAVLGVLVPQQVFERLAAQAGRQRQPGSFSAIWLDQPPARLLGLFRQILPEAKRAGVLLGPDSSAQLPALRAAAGRARIELVVETVAGEQEVMPALARLLPAVDGLLAVPDGVVYRRETVRGILLTTYRHQKPLVAFSQSYVNAGAIAAAFSTPALAALQAAELVRALPAGKVALPPPQPPAYPSVAINRQVARSLGLDPPADALVQKAVERAAENER